MTLLLALAAAGGVTWFKIVRPLAAMLEFSDESHEVAIGRGMVASAAVPAGETQDLVALMTALNARAGAQVSEPASASTSPDAMANRPGVVR